MVRKFSLPYPKGYSLRLHRIGCENRPFYLIGAMPKRVMPSRHPSKRPDEVIGSIDPLPNDKGEIIVACDMNKLCYYLGKGAQLSKFLSHLLGLAGVLPMAPRVYTNAWRSRMGLKTQGGLRPTVHPERHLLKQ